VSAHTGKPLSRASVATYLRAVSQFVRWAQQDGGASAALKVQRVTPTRRVLDTLDREQIAALEHAAGNERDKLIIRLLGDTGVRLNELLTLTADALIEQGRERYVRVDGKGARQRLVPVMPGVWARLRRYALDGRPDDVDGASMRYVFLSLRRRPASGCYERLDARAVQQMLKAAAKRAGIRKPVYPHMLRHSMVTNALRRNVNVVALAQQVGHSDLSMIQRTYAHLSATDLYRENMRVLSLDGEPPS